MFRPALFLRSVLPILACALALTACGSSGSGAGGGGSTMSGSELRTAEVVAPDDAEAVTGNIAVTWKNLDTRQPDVVQTLVNASSEVGARLRSGKQSSTVVRVISDADMGTLLSGLENNGFFENATPGVGLNSIPDIGDRKGIVIVHRDGKNWGLMLTRNMGGSPIPQAYVNCKALVLWHHGQVPSPAVRVNVDADRVFQAPPIRMERP